jgi:hypothetical protein
MHALFKSLLLYDITNTHLLVSSFRLKINNISSCCDGSFILVLDVYANATYLLWILELCNRQQRIKKKYFRFKSFLDVKMIQSKGNFLIRVFFPANRFLFPKIEKCLFSILNFFCDIGRLGVFKSKTLKLMRKCKRALGAWQDLPPNKFKQKTITLGLG